MLEAAEDGTGAVRSEFMPLMAPFLPSLLTSLFFSFVFRDRVYSVALEPVLVLALVDQAGLELTEIRLSLLPEFWD